VEETSFLLPFQEKKTISSGRNPTQQKVDVKFLILREDSCSKKNPRPS